jgi:pyridoxamine 5'-phosphate oxidase
MALATNDSADRPSVRMVLLKELAPAGYAVFYTNYGSRKAGELTQTSRAAAVLYWEQIGKQVRFEGPVVRSPAAESDAYFMSRHWRSQVNAWSSEQSRPLSDPTELEGRAARKLAELGLPASGADPKPPIPRPELWGGYRLWFDSVELWAEGADRFHERVLYSRLLVADGPHDFRYGPWTWQHLQP